MLPACGTAFPGSANFTVSILFERSSGPPKEIVELRKVAEEVPLKPPVVEPPAVPEAPEVGWVGGGGWVVGWLGGCVVGWLGGGVVGRSGGGLRLWRLRHALMRASCPSGGRHG